MRSPAHAPELGSPRLAGSAASRRLVGGAALPALTHSWLVMSLSQCLAHVGCSVNDGWAGWDLRQASIFFPCHMGPTAEMGMTEDMNVAGFREEIKDPGCPGPRPSGGSEWPCFFPSVPSQARDSPVTWRYTPNTHPFDLQALLGGGDPQDAQQKV